jgi:hypothetical protein
MIKDDGIKYLIVFLIIFIAFQSIVSYIAFQRSPWGDERHFIETARLFGNDLTLQTLAHYSEMSTPLHFIIYGLWGKIMGFELNQLRLFSPVIALTTYLLFFMLIWRVTRHGLLTLAGVLFFMFHPYMVGFSTFVFTDMLTILFLILAIYAIYTHNPLLLFIGNACALLSRQYAVFFTVAAGVYFLLILLTQKNKKDAFVPGIALVLSCLPLIGCIFLWKGLSPDSPIKTIYLKYAITYHVPALFMYIALLFLYMIPFIFIAVRHVFGRRALWTYIIMLVISGVYWLAPVIPSPSAIDGKIYTVGFFHKAIDAFSQNVLFHQSIFFICFALAMPFMHLIVTSLLNSIQTARITFTVFLDLCIVAFLLIMPFSYLWWEKYFMLLVPVLILRIILERTGMREDHYQQSHRGKTEG